MTSILTVLVFAVIGAFGIASLQDAWRPILSHLKSNKTKSGSKMSNGLACNTHTLSASYSQPE